MKREPTCHWDSMLGLGDAGKTRSDYDPAGLGLVKATCLDLASYLDDYWDELVVVGGYAPTLLVEPREGIEAHPGTLDVDLGLSLGVLKEDRYQMIAERFPIRFVPCWSVLIVGMAGNHGQWSAARFLSSLTRTTQSPRCSAALPSPPRSGSTWGSPTRQDRS